MIHHSVELSWGSISVHFSAGVCCITKESKHSLYHMLQISYIADPSEADNTSCVERGSSIFSPRHTFIVAQNRM